MSIIEKTLEIAKSQVGVRENTTNWGTQVSEYLRSVGIDYPAPWCAAYTYWCVQEASEALGLGNRVVRSAYCPYISSWSSSHNILYTTPEVGDFFLVYGTRARHIGFVTKKLADGVKTVEGNTNLNGSPEGIGVFERVRPINSRIRFVRWGALYPKEPETTKKQNAKLILNHKEISELVWAGDTLLAPIRDWGKAFGFVVSWNEEQQLPEFNKALVEVDVTIINGRGYAPVRELAQYSGLRVTFNSNNTVEITK